MAEDPTRPGENESTRDAETNGSEDPDATATRAGGDEAAASDDPDATVTRSGNAPTPDELEETFTMGGARDTAPRLPVSVRNYRILGKLGEGGMGVVYEAEQQHPRRRVALKVVRGGEFVSEQRVKMFQREAETLARLKHPNIAAIYESGRTDDGQHFFAMELVQGRTLDACLRELPERISAAELEQRLRMFVKICDAVHYAHQRGVIHRDLKPSNIFVTDAEECASRDAAAAVPEVKILDFGLARITDTDLAAASMVTEVGVIKGTLRYMSPEQARANPDEIDVRTDVYALGVILYEMLAGVHPYDLGKTSLVDALRVICEQAPAPLSDQWKGSRRPDTDIETIVGKALEKSADMRYASAAALSQDIVRYLGSQPILARPPSTMYQLRKLVARNKLPAAFAATLLVLLVGFGLWMSFLYARAETNLRRALNAEEEATLEASTANEVSDFLIGLFEVSDPEKARGDEILAREILDRGANSIEEELTDQPVLQARLMCTMGVVYRSLGMDSAALPLLQESVAQRKEHLGPDHPEVALAEIKLGGLLYNMRRLGEAKPVLEEALAILESQPERDDLATAEALNNLAAIAVSLDRDLELGRSYFEEVLAIRERVLGPDHDLVAKVLGNLGSVYAALREHELAQRTFRRAIQIRESKESADDPGIATLYQKLAAAQNNQGRFREALSNARRALQIQEKVYDPGHDRTGLTLNALGEAHSGLGEFGEARAALDRAVRIFEATRGVASSRTMQSREGLLHVLRKLGAHEEAIPVYETQVRARESTAGENHPVLVPLLREFAGSLRAVGRGAEAAGAEARARRIEETSGAGS